MSTNSKLESYLTTLNEHLGVISISDRSEIIMEIKSHVMDALEKNPQKNIEDILKDFGSAESIAQKYLDERGIKRPVKHRSTFSTFAKWAFIASASLMIILGLTLLIIVKSLTPFVDVRGDKVSLMGGLIHVDENNFRLGSAVYEISGSYSQAGAQNLKVLASNGKIELSTSTANAITWDCNVDQVEGIQPVVNGATVELNFSKYKDLDCSIEVPQKIATRAELSNGKIELSEATGNFDLSLQNGNIEISPLPTTPYNFDLQVKRGMLDNFESSKDKNAPTIKARLENGKIQNSID